MRFCIAGAGGRMGRMLIEAVLGSAGDRLVGALDAPGSAAIGQDAAAFLGRACGIAVSDAPREALAGADVLIDFTRPEGTLAHLAACRELGVRAVVGTTGFDDAGKAAIADAARAIPIVFAPNMSVGVNVVLMLLDKAARALGIAILGTILFSSVGWSLQARLDDNSQIPDTVKTQIVDAVVDSAGNAIPGLKERDPASFHEAQAAFSDGTRYSAFAAAGFLAVGLLATLRLDSGRPEHEDTDEAGTADGVAADEVATA